MSVGALLRLPAVALRAGDKSTSCGLITLPIRLLATTSLSIAQAIVNIVMHTMDHEFVDTRRGVFGERDIVLIEALAELRPIRP